MPYAWQTETGSQILTIAQIADLYPGYSRYFVTQALAAGASCLADLRAHEAKTPAKPRRGKGVGITIAPQGQFRHKVQQRIPWHREGLS